MRISSIELKNYRNYSECYIGFDKNVNIFFGDNAQGKTNILEAVYVCTTTKSHRPAKDRDLIRFGENEAHIKMILEEDDGCRTRIDMHLKKNKNKGIAVNGIVLKKASELFGYLNVVFFSPEDLALIKNGPAERRKFVDCELCQLDKIYLHNLTAYNKLLNQRNCILKEIHLRPEYRELIRVYEEQMCSLADEIIKRRRSFIESLNGIISEIHKNLSGGKEELKVFYEPDVCEGELLCVLDKNRDRDYRQKQTGNGPQRDDISFVINDVDIRRFGSQGQQRCAALSLKMSEIRLVEMMTGKKPVLLLDDVLSELDSNRQRFMLDSIKDVQTLITCTGLDEFVNSRFHIDRVYRVTNGHIIEKSINTK